MILFDINSYPKSKKDKQSATKEQQQRRKKNSPHTMNTAYAMNA